MPPPTKSIPDKREKLRRKQFQKDLERNLRQPGEASTKIRVRFAPSPTGFLHIGGARTALYNWLFAKNKDGAFVLRIEDTDRARSTKKAIEGIVSSLRWLGLDWDEGPYHQMDRLSLYQSEAEKLLKAKKAYCCYCLPGELEERRKNALMKSKELCYDRRCLELSRSEIEKFKRAGRKASLRFLTPDSGRTVVSDLIRGRVVFENSVLDDFIILRSDKIPTYNFAAVVDDGKMGITHVIRGEDHLSNTPKQVLIYKALGYELPAFAHLPMILAEDRSPLSKRHGAVSAEKFKEEGYLPEALINYLALLGWSYDDATTFFSIDQLIEKFSLERVSKSPAAFDLEKLDWMNGSYIRNLPVEELTQRCLPFLKKAGFFKEDEIVAGEKLQRVEKMVSLGQKRIKKLSEIVPTLNIFFTEELTHDPVSVGKALEGDEAPKILGMACEVLHSVKQWHHGEIEKKLRALQQELGLKPKVVFQAIRVATTGQIVSPI